MNKCNNSRQRVLPGCVNFNDVQMLFGASGGTRTPTPSRVPDFESGASTGSATEAIDEFRVLVWRVTHVYPKVTAFVKPATELRARVSQPTGAQT